MMQLPFKGKKSLEELQLENERLRVEKENQDLQISLAQQRAIRARLRESGLTLKSFGGSFRAALRWIRGHNQ